MEAEAFPQEIVAEDEPRYFRRQKPVEIRRRKFGKKAWKSYLRITVGVGATLAVAISVYAVGAFLLASPQMSLQHPDQVALAGNHFVSRGNILEVFAPDRGRSVLRIPLDARRKQIESLAWVESAVVRRALPNHVQVEIVERTPVAFLRDASDLALIDGHGVILDRPVEGNFHFPVVTGIHPGLPSDERERRMQIFSGFLQQINAARTGSSDAVSEVDLSDAKNVRATLDTLPTNGGPSTMARKRRPASSRFRRSRFRKSLPDATEKHNPMAHDSRPHRINRPTLRRRSRSKSRPSSQQQRANATHVHRSRASTTGNVALNGAATRAPNPGIQNKSIASARRATRIKAAQGQAEREGSPVGEGALALPHFCAQQCKPRPASHKSSYANQEPEFEQERPPNRSPRHRQHKNLRVSRRTRRRFPLHQIPSPRRSRIERLAQRPNRKSGFGGQLDPPRSRRGRRHSRHAARIRRSRSSRRPRPRRK